MKLSWGNIFNESSKKNVFLQTSDKFFLNKEVVKKLQVIWKLTALERCG